MVSGLKDDPTTPTFYRMSGWFARPNEILVRFTEFSEDCTPCCEWQLFISIALVNLQYCRLYTANCKSLYLLESRTFCRCVFQNHGSKRNKQILKIITDQRSLLTMNLRWRPGFLPQLWCFGLHQLQLLKFTVNNTNI